MIKRLLGRLFPGGAGPAEAAAGEAVEYQGYTIRPAPVRDGGGWRVTGEICHERDGETRTHAFIRADVISDRDAAIETTVNKAKTLIDQQGERIFD